MIDRMSSVISQQSFAKDNRQWSVVSRQLSVATDNEQQTTYNKIQNTETCTRCGTGEHKAQKLLPDAVQGNTDNRPLYRMVQGRARNTELKKVAMEMESLFAYQLIKIMRETANSMSSKKSGLGYNTYMGLFDTEISRLFAERGLGLQEAIMNWLERLPNINDAGDDIDNKQD